MSKIKTSVEPKTPRVLVIGKTRIRLRRKVAAELVKRDILYVDSMGESKPKRPHLHLNPENKFTLAQVEELMIASARR